MRTYQDNTFKVTIQDIIYNYTLLIRDTSPLSAMEKAIKQFNKLAINDVYLRNLLYVDGYKIKVERIVER